MLRRPWLTHAPRKPSRVKLTITTISSEIAIRLHRSSICRRARLICSFSGSPRLVRFTATRLRSAFSRISKEALQIQQGSLYPALHRLENKKFPCCRMGPERDRARG